MKPHQQIFQRKSSLPMRYSHMFLRRRQNIMSQSISSLVQISQNIEISSFHTHLHPVPLGPLFFLHSNGQAWPEHQLFHPGQKCQLKLRAIYYKVQLQKQLPHIQGGERNTQQTGPINLPGDGLGGQRNQNLWKAELLGRDITQCKQGAFLSTKRLILSDY